MKISELEVGHVTITEQSAASISSYASASGKCFVVDGSTVYRYPPHVPRDVARAILAWHRFFPVVRVGDRMHRKSDFFRVPRVSLRSALEGGYMRISDSGYLTLSEMGLAVPVTFVEATVTIEIPLRLRDDVLRFIHDRN